MGVFYGRGRGRSNRTGQANGRAFWAPVLARACPPNVHVIRAHIAVVFVLRGEAEVVAGAKVTQFAACADLGQWIAWLVVGNVARWCVAKG